MKLKFAEQDIRQWADRYVITEEEEELMSLRDTVRREKRLTKPQLRLVCHWKSRRNDERVRKNDEQFVEEVSRFALTATTERARIAALTLLDGVMWPTASAILHLFHADRYPMLDRWALASIGYREPTHYSFEFWWRYVEFCRDIARRNELDMRTLDRALWWYTSEQSKKARSEK